MRLMHQGACHQKQKIFTQLMSEVWLAGTLDLALRLPSGDRLMRRFKRTDRVLDVHNFLRWKGTDVTGHILTAFPSKVPFADLDHPS